VYYPKLLKLALMGGGALGSQPGRRTAPATLVLAGAMKAPARLHAKSQCSAAAVSLNRSAAASSLS
jgi:hypothetical protein